MSFDAREPEEIREELGESASRLEELESLDPTVRQGMKTLLVELGQLLGEGGTEEELEHVSRLSGEFRKLLDEASDEESVLGRSKQVLEHAAAQAEADAPVLTNVARKLIEALADIGI